MVRAKAPAWRYSIEPEQLGLPLDVRGLVPLELARQTVRRATVVERGESHVVAGQPFQPTDADRLWFALLSLETADEFVREASRLEWKHPLRGWDNVDALVRFGEAALPWIDEMLRRPAANFIFRTVLERMLVAAGPTAARYVVRHAREGDTDPDALGLTADWLRANGTPAWTALAREVAAGDADARRAIVALGKRSPRTAKIELRKAVGPAADAMLAGGGLTVESVLAVLDAAAAAPVGERVPWPTLRASAGHFELHAMRLVAVRAEKGDDWGIAIEVVQGDVLDRKARWPAVVQRYVYGSRVSAGGRHLLDARPLDVRRDGERLIAPAAATLDAELAESLDLRPGRSITGAVENWMDVLAIRAALVLSEHAIFPDPKPLLRALRVTKPRVLVVAHAFEHTDGPAHGKGALADPPSARVAYRSLAEAIVHRDAARFRPGNPNTAWRLHAEQTQPFTWSEPGA